MTDWRLLGYVPDSDEEDEVLTRLPTASYDLRRDEADIERDAVSHEAVASDHDLGLRNEQTSQHPIIADNDDSTAGKLERAFNHGLRIVRDVRAAIPVALDDPQSDSPLSSPPSSREHSPSRISEPTLQSQQPDALMLLRLPDPARSDQASAFPRRSLRERAPIQQHPYLLEDAHYRQQMRGSGVKPINVPTVSKPSAHALSGDDSQPTEDYNSQPEESFNNDLPMSSPNTQASNDAARERHNSSPQLYSLEDADDELPDFSDILNRRKSVAKHKSRLSGQARLTVTVPPPKTSSRAKDVSSFSADENIVAQDEVSRENSFRVPPSPPVSASLGPENDGSEGPFLRNQNDPDGFTPTPRLPLTPLFSSETGSRKRPRVIPSSSEASQSSEGEDTREATPLSEEDDSQGIRAIQAKLRGKLPASHVMIEMRDRNRTSRQSRRSPWSPLKSANMPGVARITTSKKGSTNPPFANSFLGESESEESEDPRAAMEATHEADARPVFLDFFEDDGMITVDNLMDEPEIDPMLTTTAISRASANNPKLRQKRITNGWVISNKRSISDAKAGRLSATHKASVSRQQQPLKRRRKTGQKKSVIDVNVLDAPGIRNVEKRKQPPFLKIAARQAKRTSSKTVQGSRKFFLLATEQDTLEINNQLKEYKRVRRNFNGSVSAASVAEPMAQTSNAASVGRATMCSPQISKSSTRSSSVGEVEQLKQSTKSLLSRLLRREADVPDSAPRSNGAHYDNLADLNEPQSGVRRLQVPIARHNRSGIGQFLSRVQQPRAAQLEDESGGVRTNTESSTKRTDPEPRMLRAAQVWTPNTPGAATTVVKQAKTRRSRKKQIPQKSTLSTAKMSAETVFDTAESIEEVRTPGDAQDEAERDTTYVYASPEKWTKRILSKLSTLQALPEFTTFRGNAIGSGALQTTVERASCSYYDPLVPTSRETTVRTPISRKTIPCGLCHDGTSTLIMTALCEVDRVFEDQPVQFQDSSPQSDNDKYDRCIDFVQDLVRYMSDSAFFQDTDRIASFVLSSVAWLDSFANRLAEQASIPGIEAKKIIQCVNWLMIYTCQLYTLVRTRPALQKRTSTAFGNIMDLMFDLVLKRRNLLQCVVRLQSVCDESITGNMGIFDSTFPEAESVVIAWHVCKTLSLDNSRERFYQKCLPSLDVHHTEYIVDRLSVRVLALHFVLPLTHVTPIGHTVRSLEDAEQTDGVCFSIIGSYLRDLATHVPIAQAPSSVGRLIEVMEDLCLTLIEQWHWHAPHTLAVSFLKTYVWNCMLPFHTVPSEDSLFNDLRSITGSRSVSDNDFFKLLSIIAICIRRFCHPKSNNSDEPIPPSASKIRGFIFSLIPNNAPPHDARQELTALRFLALKNHFALYLTLYRHAPDGCRPRVQQLENQVDLTSSHFVVCKLAVIAWETVATIEVRQAVSANDTLRDVGRWMNNMLKQTIVRLEDHAQPDAVTLFRELLEALATVLAKCDTEPTARVLLGGDAFATVSKLMVENEIHFKNEGVLVAGLKAMDAYMKLVPTNRISDTLTADVQLVAKHLLQQTLSAEKLGSNAFVWQLMTLWMNTAQPMVRSFHKYWNDYVDPHSGLSIDFLSGLRNSYAVNEVKECFYSELIEADQQFFFLECRPTVFATWIATLLLPIHLLRFEHILTNKILQHERESLMIKDLATTLLKHDNKRQLTIQDIADSRITILRHVIQNIYGQSAASEDEWLAGGLDPGSLTKLLKTMTTTMKSTWLDLRDDPGAQSDYTTLVHAIINELETYPYPDFKIDPWFTDGTEFPRPEQSLDNIFKCRFGEEGGEIAKSSIVTFRHMLRRAGSSGEQAPFVQDLIRVFHCLDPLRVREVSDGTRKFEYSIDLAKQAKFIQIVLPAYFERTIPTSPGFIIPLVEFLTSITSRIHFRIDNIDPPHMVQFITALAANLYAVRNVLESTRLNNACAAPMIGFARVATASIFSLLEHGIKIDTALYEQISGNILGIFAVVHAHLPPDEPVTYSPPATSTSDSGDIDGDTTVISDNVVYDCWTDPPGEARDLVPDSLTWTLHFDGQEPALSGAEQELRDFTRRDLDHFRGVGLASITLRHNMLQEMWAFIRLVRGMKLVADVGDEWVKHEDEDELEYE